MKSLAFVISFALLIIVATAEDEQCCPERIEACLEPIQPYLHWYNETGDVDQVCRIFRSAKQCLDNITPDCNYASGTLSSLEGDIRDLCGLEDGERGVLHCMADNKYTFRREARLCGAKIFNSVLDEVMGNSYSQNDVICITVTHMDNCMEPKVRERCGEKAAELFSEALKVEARRRVPFGPSDLRCQEILGGNRRKRSLKLERLTNMGLFISNVESLFSTF